MTEVIKTYYENGQIHTIRSYSNNVINGEFKIYDKNGIQKFDIFDIFKHILYLFK